MKLVFAIVHDEDAPSVTEELGKQGISTTRLCSTGGFLKHGNTTILTGIEESRLDEVIGIIKSNSKSRVQPARPPMPPGVAGVVQPMVTTEIIVGGATLFILDVERFEKV